MARESFSRALSEPKNAGYLRDQVVRAVAISSAPAAARLSKLMTTARSEHVQLQAVEFSLKATGIGPKNESHISIGVDIKAGYVLDLRHPSDQRPMKVIDAGEPGGIAESTSDE